MQKRTMRRPGFGSQATLHALGRLFHRRVGGRGSRTISRRSFTSQLSRRHPSVSTSMDSSGSEEPSEPRIRLLWQYRVMKWALMPIYFLFRTLWKLLSWCWHIASVQQEVGSDRHRWDWRRWPKHPEWVQNIARRNDENGRFFYIAQLLLNVRGSLAFCDESWPLNHWKIPVELSRDPMNETWTRTHVDSPQGRSRIVSQLNRRSGQYTHRARGCNIVNERTVLHLPPQDLIELILRAR